MNKDNKRWYERIWPTTWPGAVLGLGLGAMLFASILFLLHDPEGRSGLRAVYAIFNDKGEIDVKVDHVFTFSTASFLTKYDIARMDKSVDPLEARLAKVKQQTPWYYVDDPAAGACTRDTLLEDCLGQQVVSFIDKLNSLKAEALAKRIQGYEYYESVGSGSHPIKRGLTWKVTVPNGSHFSREDMIALYVEYWKRPTGIYVEDTTIPSTRR